MIASLKKKPNDGFFGATSNAGLIAGELLKQHAGLKTAYVPYKANPNALAAHRRRYDFWDDDRALIVEMTLPFRRRGIAESSTRPAR